MRFQLVSDLHLDIHKDNGAAFISTLNSAFCEYLVIAGDLCESACWHEHTNLLADICSRFDRVIYVLGNHEYYKGSMPDVHWRFKLLEKKFSNLHCLENETLEIEGIKFAGTTLWFPYDPMNFAHEKYMNDFWEIKDFRDKVYEWNRYAKEFLFSCDADVWITHHLPHCQSIDRIYHGNNLNRFFLSEIGEMILNKEPQVVVHGHTHIPCHYRLGYTRIHCNPMGYPGENKRVYSPMTIEVEKW